MIINYNPYYFIPHWHWCQLHVPHIIGTSHSLDPPDSSRPCEAPRWPICPSGRSRLPQASERSFDAWLDELEARLAAPDADWHRITRDMLFEIWYPGLSDYDALVSDPATPGGDPGRAAEPRPAQRHARARVLRRRGSGALRPGQAAALALAELRPLAPRGRQRPPGGRASAACWRSISSPACGRNFKCFHFVEFSYGYNMEVGDDCVVHRYVLLDDRGGITLGNRVSISDYANIYSHTHSIVDQKDVTNARTVLEDDVRITYHATVLAGVRVGRNAMVGAHCRGHEERPAVPRERRHPRQVDPHQAECAAGGLRDRARGPAARPRSRETDPPAGALVRVPVRPGGVGPARQLPAGVVARRAAGARHARPRDLGRR